MGGVATRRVLVIGIVALLSCVSCASQQDLVATKARIEGLETVITRLTEKPQPKPEKHYQFHSSGNRSWRFDPATGAVCTLLAPNPWSKSDKQSSCACADALDQLISIPAENEQQSKRAELAIDRACGGQEGTKQ
jgi:hypothetical protein